MPRYPSRRFLMTSTVVIASAFAIPALSYAAESPTAVVMALRGDVFFDRGDDEWLPAGFGTDLESGDRLRTATGSYADLLFESGQTIHLGEGSNITISGGPGTPPSAPAEDFAAGMNIMRVSRRGGTALATVMRDAPKPQELNTLTPGSTVLLDARPTFRWSSPAALGEIKVVVYEPSGVVFEQSVQGKTWLDYPQTAPPLQPGVQYSWTIETTDPLVYPPRRAPVVFFEVASDADRHRIEDSLREIDARELSEEGRAVLKALVYSHHGMLDRAIEVAEAQHHAGNLDVDPMLLSLYEQAGRKSDALALLREPGSKVR